MLKQQQLCIAAFLVLALGMAEAEAKRVGGGRSSGASRPAATKPAQKEDKAVKKTEDRESDAPALNVRLPGGSRSNAQSAPAASPAAAAAVPAAAGAAAAAAALPAAAAIDADAAARQKENEEKLARAAAEEEKRAALIKAYEQELAEREKQLVREKQERDARRARAAYESQCQFKPVMSDEDIARCRSVFSN